MKDIEQIDILHKVSNHILLTYQLCLELGSIVSQHKTVELVISQEESLKAYSGKTNLGRLKMVKLHTLTSRITFNFSNTESSFHSTCVQCNDDDI